MTSGAHHRMSVSRCNKQCMERDARVKQFLFWKFPTSPDFTTSGDRVSSYNPQGR